MKALVSLLSLILLLAPFGAGVFFRLAPSDPERWHVDPLTAPAPGPGGVVMRPGGDLRSPLYAEAPRDLLAAFAAVAGASPRTEAIAGSPLDGRMTFVARSRVWGFPDYITVTAVPEPNGGARLAVLARLRFGRSDLGVNRARLKGWLASLAPREAGGA